MGNAGAKKRKLELKEALKKRSAALLSLGTGVGTDAETAWDFKVSDDEKDYAVAIHVKTAATIGLVGDMTNIVYARDSPTSKTEMVYHAGAREGNEFFSYQLDLCKEMLPRPGANTFRAFLGEEGKARFGKWTMWANGDSSDYVVAKEEDAECALVFGVDGAYLFGLAAFPRSKEKELSASREAVEALLAARAQRELARTLSARAALVAVMEEKGVLRAAGGAWDFKVSRESKKQAVAMHVATGAVVAFEADTLSRVHLRESPSAPQEVLHSDGTREKDNFYSFQLDMCKAILPYPGASSLGAFLAASNKPRFGKWKIRAAAGGRIEFLASKKAEGVLSFGAEGVRLFGSSVSSFPAAAAAAESTASPAATLATGTGGGGTCEEQGLPPAYGDATLCAGQAERGGAGAAADPDNER